MNRTPVVLATTAVQDDV